MEIKTRFGLSVPIMAAIICLIALFGGYIPLILLVGYVMLCERDAWLRQTALGVMLLCLIFSLLNAILGLIPDLIGLVNNLVAIFEGSFSIPVISRIINFFTSVLSFLKTILLLALGIISLLGKRIKVPALEKFIGKYLTNAN